MMRTTLLNPVVWLLTMTCAAALVGAIRRERARPTVDRVVTLATTWPALAILVVLAAGGLGSRLVLGYLSPGAYAEEVVGARAFLAERRVYGGDARAELTQWMAEAPASADAWTLPGITPCQASALRTRPQFYTSQGHPPTLLLASVPVVQVLGGRGLYVVLALTSAIACVVIAGVLLREAGVTPRSRAAVLLGAAVVGWQPIVAGIRQGDAVVPAGALVVLAWHWARGHAVRAGIAGGVASCMTLPALAVLPALCRVGWPAGAVASTVLVVVAAIVAGIAGPLVFVDFSSTLTLSARTYAQAAYNYALMGRGLTQGLDTLVLGMIAVTVIVTVWRGRTRDTAIGAWMTVGLLVAPVVWSQHLVLTLVPLAVLFRRAATGPALALAAWAGLALLLSLPDPAVALLFEVLVSVSPALATVPVVSVALVALWCWLVVPVAT